jgi:hypothetical protein
LARLLPILDRFGDRPGLRAVAGENFGLGLGDPGEALLECFGDAAVEVLATALEERGVGRVLSACLKT